jgi:hypothetical protein
VTRLIRIALWSGHTRPTASRMVRDPPSQTPLPFLFMDMDLTPALILREVTASFLLDSKLDRYRLGIALVSPIPTMDGWPGFSCLERSKMPTWAVAQCIGIVCILPGSF